ncbi:MULTISPECIES: hypothetical protein [unclassified Synechococcus]|jgi:hypothetical protein|uniref:hypothetical protein n=1 Tax=unclassified Synechococcus TaxID=2626047 RepID=UPI00103C9831|nr:MULTISPECIES: hypothetical protein [unclassified Synechococcus]
MSFLSPMPFFGELNDNRQFNNADSFAMAFDEAWKDSVKADSNQDVTTRLASVMHGLQEHPFMESSPEMAQQVAAFRLRLLDL